MNDSGKRMAMAEKDLQAACRDLLGTVPDRVERPGGAQRKTVVVYLGENSYVILRRSGNGRAALEAEVLRRLSGTGLVPGLIHTKGAVIVQEHVAGRRLAEVLDASPQDNQVAILKAGCDSLLRLQDAGRATGLVEIAPAIGERPGWIDDLVSVPERLCADLGLAGPVVDTGRIRALVQPVGQCFVKWDARPGNALIRPDGTLCWFDWEHCGLRNTVDDIVWLLADEWSPAAPEAEQHALTSIAARDKGGMDEITARFCAMAILHSFVRLSLIRTRHARHGWSSHATALRHDLVGVTPEHVRRLCRRGQRWAGQVAELGGYGAVFDRIADATELA